jgi:hypothetical protein
MSLTRHTRFNFYKPVVYHVFLGAQTLEVTFLVFENNKSKSFVHSLVLTIVQRDVALFYSTKSRKIVGQVIIVRYSRKSSYKDLAHIPFSLVLVFIISQLLRLRLSSIHIFFFDCSFNVDHFVSYEELLFTLQDSGYTFLITKTNKGKSSFFTIF